MNIFLIILLFFSFVFILIIFLIVIYDSNEKKEKNSKEVKINNYEIKFSNNFQQAKESFQYLINQTEEISKTWNNIEDLKIKRNLKQSSGIYAIYINTNDIKNIIPVYIGQAKDIFKRWKQQQTQIKKIIEENSNTRIYKRIIYYLQLYNLKLKDLNFCVLEKCSEIELKKKEKFYINLFNSDIYGFNQTKDNENYFYLKIKR